MIAYITKFIIFALNRDKLILFNLTIKKNSAISFDLNLDKEINFTLYRER